MPLSWSIKYFQKLQVATLSLTTWSSQNGYPHNRNRGSEVRKILLPLPVYMQQKQRHIYPLPLPLYMQQELVIMLPLQAIHITDLHWGCVIKCHFSIAKLTVRSMSLTMLYQSFCYKEMWCEASSIQKNLRIQILWENMYKKLYTWQAVFSFPLVHHLARLVAEVLFAQTSAVSSGHLAVTNIQQLYFITQTTLLWGRVCFRI